MRLEVSRPSELPEPPRNYDAEFAAFRRGSATASTERILEMVACRLFAATGCDQVVVVLPEERRFVWRASRARETALCDWTLAFTSGPPTSTRYAWGGSGDPENGPMKIEVEVSARRTDGGELWLMTWTGRHVFDPGRHGIGEKRFLQRCARLLGSLDFTFLRKVARAVDARGPQPLLRADWDSWNGRESLFNDRFPVWQPEFRAELDGPLSSNCGPLLILGETGTGKSRLARAFHASGCRRLWSLLCLRPRQMGRDELLGRLFGRTHPWPQQVPITDPRAGLLRKAEGGTVLLEDIAPIPEELGSPLKAVLKSLERFSKGGAASEPNCDLIMTATRKALYRSLGPSARNVLDFVVFVEVPPLRERPADVEGLARRFALAKGASGVDPDAVTLLQAMPWPENVRGLKRVIGRATVPGRPVGKADVARAVRDLAVRGR